MVRARSFVVLGFVAAAASAGPDEHGSAVAEIRTFAELERQRQEIPGMTLGFVKDDFTWGDGFGSIHAVAKVACR